MAAIPSIDWGRTAAITSVGLALWRVLAWLLGLGWGRYVRDALEKSMRPEFESLHIAVRRQRFQTARRLQRIEERLDRLETKANVPQR